VTNGDAEREKEARDALERVHRDSQTVGASALAQLGRRAGRHFGGQDAIGAGEGGSTDPVELWGRRIGRFLSVIAFVLLSLWLLHQLELL
jgi:hypothetical protein